MESFLKQLFLEGKCRSGMRGIHETSHLQVKRERCSTHDQKPSKRVPKCRTETKMSCRKETRQNCRDVVSTECRKVAVQRCDGDGANDSINKNERCNQKCEPVYWCKVCN